MDITLLFFIHLSHWTLSFTRSGTCLWKSLMYFQDLMLWQQSIPELLSIHSQNVFADFCLPQDQWGDVPGFLIPQLSFDPNGACLVLNVSSSLISGALVCRLDGEKIAPDLWHLLMAWCEDSHCSWFQATRWRQWRQSREEMHAISSHEPGIACSRTP